MAGWTVKSVAAGATLQVKDAPGVIHSITVSFGDAASQVVSIYNSAAGAANKIIDMAFQAAGTGGQTWDTEVKVLDWEMTNGIFIDASTIEANGYVVVAYA